MKVNYCLYTNHIINLNIGNITLKATSYPSDRFRFIIILLSFHVHFRDDFDGVFNC